MFAGIGLASVIAWAMGLFHIYTAGFGLLTAMLQRGVHLTFALVLIFMLYPFKPNWRWGRVLDALFVGLALLVGFYMAIYASPAKLTERALVGLSPLDLAIGALLVLLLLEATRRVCGNGLVILALVFICYAYFGRDLPSLLAHRGYGPVQIIEQVAFTTEGIYGIPLGVSATFIILFILFGAFLEKSGAGEFFVNMAYAIAGKSRSGPAMTAVLSSSLMGTISGSAAANVVTTGTFTIPLMKRVGYHPTVAGAIEAVASTGGQILPPVMGAAAFIMAEILGIAYGQVVIAAMLPAVLYFVSVGLMVHLEAVKAGMKGMPKEQLPVLWVVFKQGFFYLIPLATIIYTLVVLFYSPTRAALLAIIVTVVVSYFSRQSRMTLRRILDALESGAKASLVVVAACATAGIIIGIVTMTGLGLRFSSLIVTASGGHLLLALLLTAVACLVLGMGLPTSAAYIITATLGAPVLVQLGLTPIAAHLFVLYYACISAITPPVAIAAYAASGLAQSPPIQTGFYATKFGIIAFVVPFMFAYGPELLLIGEPLAVIRAIVTALLGVWLLVGGVQGYVFRRINVLQRVVLLGGALFLIETGEFTDLIGLLLGLLVVVPQLFPNKSRRAGIPQY